MQRGSAPASLTQGRLFGLAEIMRGACLFYHIDGTLYLGVDILTNTAKITSDFVVGDANDPQTIALQKAGALGILFKVAFLIVLAAIQLNDELCLCTIEVSNIFSKHLLSGKSDGVIAEELIPQAAFLLGHFLSQLLCQRNELLIVLWLHDNTSIQKHWRGSAPAPLCKRREGLKISDDCPRHDKEAKSTIHRPRLPCVKGAVSEAD